MASPRAASKAPKSKKATPKAYHHGDLRRTLLDASVALIAEHGVEALSLREAARAAGVSPAAPYHHFASKSELLGAIAARGFAGLDEAQRAAVAALPDPEDPMARLAALGHAYVAFAIANPTEFRLMFRPTLVGAADLPEGCDPASGFHQLIDAVGRVARTLPPGLIDEQALTLAAWSLVHGAAELVLEGPIGAVEGRAPVPAAQIGPAVVGVLSTLLGTAAKSRAAR